MGEQLKNSRAVSRRVAIVIAIAVGMAAAWALRYGVLESEVQAALCRNGAGGVFCSARAMLGWAIHYQLFGLGGALLAAAAWLPRLGPLAVPGLLFSTAALLLYNTTFGAIGFIVALLALLR